MLPEVSQKSEKVQPNLNNLQANILKFHGRDQAYHLFIRFTGDQDKVKSWIQEYAKDYVTSAATQLKDVAKRKDNPNYTGGLLSCFFLSADGYEALGYETKMFEDDSFRRGMEDGTDYVLDLGTRSNIFGNKDFSSGEWQKEYQGEIHAMILLAQNCREINPSLEDMVTQVISSLQGIAEVFHIEHGKRLLTKEGEDLEHFHYRDGISNPSFFEKGETKGNREDRIDPSSPLNLVLARDPYAGEANYDGSYFVFRKLKQDVDVFNSQVRELSRFANHGKPERTGAQIIGRFRNGTPVTDTKSPQGSATNDFNFDADDGRRCPMHAHIRRTNPRDGRERNRQIIRRGIPYGKPGDDEVGLLFMCYQRSIYDQFEFIQRVWIDSPNHPEPGSGTDPLVGQNRSAVPQQWPIEYDNPKAGTYPFNFGGHVTLRGGEYFFAPSLSFLKNIKNIK